MATIPDLSLEAGLPANIDAEKTILGAILLDNAAHAEAAEVGVERLELAKRFESFERPTVVRICSPNPMMEDRLVGRRG